MRSSPDRSPPPRIRSPYEMFRGRSPPPKRFKDEYLITRKERGYEDSRDRSPGHSDMRDDPPVTGSNGIPPGPSKLWATGHDVPPPKNRGNAEKPTEPLIVPPEPVESDGMSKDLSFPMEETVQDRIRAAWSKADALPHTESSMTVTTLISELTKVHVRLIDAKKTYDDESLKLEAFESLAARFDLPRALAASVGQPAHGAPPLEHPTVQLSPTKSIDPRKRPQRSASQVGETSEDTLVPEATDINGQGVVDGPQLAHHALLETLHTIRTRRLALEKRIHGDFEEMASILQKIWVGTLTTKINASNTKFGSASHDKENGQPGVGTREPDAAATGTQPEGSSGSKLSSTKHATEKETRKSSRKVEFEDEMGKSHREKHTLRTLEDKVSSLERKLSRFHAAEKELMKLKAELKSQKEEMNLMRSTLDVQAKIIANLVDEHSMEGGQEDEGTEPNGVPPVE